MKHSATAVSALALACLASCANSAAQEPPRTAPTPSYAISEPSAPGEIPENVRVSIRRDPNAMFVQLLGELYRYSSTGVVTQADIDLWTQIEAARRRVRVWAALLIFDLDGDGIVTAAEIDAGKRFAQQNEKTGIDTALVKADLDGDGSLSLTELLNHVQQDAETQGATRSRASANLMMFDLNGDGKVDALELHDAIHKIAAEPVPETSQPPSPGSPGRPACILPPPSAAAETIALSVYEGDGLSTVAVSGPDVETTVVRVNVEPGTTPIYLFVTGYASLIWKVEGATSRIERIVVQPGSEKRSAGVSGIDASRVSFVPVNSCGEHVTESESGKAVLAKARLSASLGREMDRFIAYYEPGGVSLPTGAEIEQRSRKRAAGPTFITEQGTFVIQDGKPVAIDIAVANRTERDLANFHPAGLIQIDPKQVVAPTPPAYYDVLPQQAGLLQLIAEGALRYTSDYYYVIEKPIARFPAGLTGAHRVNFILRTGIPMPGGSPGHSSVTSEETGECLVTSCR